MLQINNLTVNIDSKIILNNFSINLLKGQKIFLTGSNGSGKSTLAQTIIGNPNCRIVSGNILFDNQDLDSILTEERSRMGIFVSFQSPIEIPGLSLLAFAKEIITANLPRAESLSSKEIIAKVEIALEIVGLDKSFLTRDLNLNCSGGEKKKIELLQLLILEPKLIILDEIEAGLDQKFLIEFINILKTHILKPDSTIIIITHNPKLIVSLPELEVVNMV
jgi:Fe-S cluster assembly ATP-binding protein